MPRISLMAVLFLINKLTVNPITILNEKAFQNEQYIWLIQKIGKIALQI